VDYNYEKYFFKSKLIIPSQYIYPKIEWVVVIVILLENEREQDMSSIKSFNLYMPGI